MRASAALSLALLATLVAAEIPDFFPCSFHGEFHTRVMNKKREVVATSIDQVYHDNGDYWRWDSNFKNDFGLIPSHDWIIIWRPDVHMAYHDLGAECILNDGDASMTPLPYDWFLLNTNGISWFALPGTWEGMPVYIYHSKYFAKDYAATCVTDIYVLKDDESWVLINGTLQTDDGLIDLTFSMDVISFEHNTPLKTSLFIPSPHCPNATLAKKAPADPSSDFKKSCYKSRTSAGSSVVSSLATVLLFLLASLLF